MKYPLTLKKIIHGSKYQFNRLFSDNYLELDWSKHYKNFGDILNPILVGFLSSKKILNVKSLYTNSEHLLAIGSILDRATRNSVIWGSGYISSNSKFVSVPKKVCAVRGPLTRELLLKQGVECPEVFGDPALLLARFYKPKVEKKYKLGIVPHYVDKNNTWLNNFSDDVKIIDVQNSDPLKVVDDICSCENIASSSLHGVIISDAYRIPNSWISISDKITGGSFKFLDYFKSIGDNTTKTININKDTSENELIDKCILRKLEIDLDKLVDSFPEDYK